MTEFIIKRCLSTSYFTLYKKEKNNKLKRLGVYCNKKDIKDACIRYNHYKNNYKITGNCYTLVPNE